MDARARTHARTHARARAHTCACVYTHACAHAQDIDGFLVGGASLKPDFVKIIAGVKAGRA